MTIKRKIIRDFMQNYMREWLFGGNRISRETLCGCYAEFTKRKEDNLSLDEKIEFINAVKNFCNGSIISRPSDEGTYQIAFLVDPTDTASWNRFLNNIYQEV